jgi:hypothetical protein
MSLIPEFIFDMSEVYDFAEKMSFIIYVVKSDLIKTLKKFSISYPKEGTSTAVCCPVIFSSVSAFAGAVLTENFQ